MQVSLAARQFKLFCKNYQKEYATERTFLKLRWRTQMDLFSFQAKDQRDEPKVGQIKPNKWSIRPKFRMFMHINHLSDISIPNPG